MIETTDSNIHPVDSLIERTLSRDAESTRKRFAAIPNAQLTAKLALSTASRGLLSGLGAKLALYAGGALLIGSAVYFIPSMGQTSHLAISSTVKSGHSGVPSVQHSSASAVTPSAEQNTSESRTQSSARTSASTSHALPLKLDEGDGRNIPHITNPKYEGPLK